MIYAIGCENYVKFGVSATKAGLRLDQLQTGNPFRLVLLAEANWLDSNEKMVHRYLVDHRVRGEWFELCEPVAQVIDAMHLDERIWREMYINRFPVRLRKAIYSSFNQYIRRC